MVNDGKPTGRREMRTLDEVIKAFEYTYKNDPIAWTYGVDALHYLKEYQEQRDQIDALPDYYNLVNFWTESQANPELTWDELKNMGGKPIWIEYADDGEQTGWALIVKNPERPLFGKPKLFTFVRDEGKFYLTISGYGKRWKAYRKERT